MDYLGLLCLGAFVGTIATLGLSRVESIREWQTVLGFTFPAILSGAAMVLVDHFRYSPAFGCYPLGLVAALMWAYIKTAFDNLNADKWRVKILGWLHLTAAALVSIAAASIAIIPAYLQLRAELDIPPQTRIDILIKHNVNDPKPPVPSPEARKAVNSHVDTGNDLSDRVRK